MANTKSALKRVRQSEVSRDRNRSYRSRMRTAVKALRAAVEAGDGDKARELLTPTVSLVNATARKGVIHANAASRTTSRLTRAVTSLEG